MWSETIIISQSYIFKYDYKTGKYCLMRFVWCSGILERKDERKYVFLLYWIDVGFIVNADKQAQEVGNTELLANRNFLDAKLEESYPGKSMHTMDT